MFKLYRYAWASRMVWALFGFRQVSVIDRRAFDQVETVTKFRSSSGSSVPDPWLTAVPRIDLCRPGAAGWMLG